MSVHSSRDRLVLVIMSVMWTILLSFAAVSFAAIDPELLRSWERLQESRPRAIESTGAIAAPEEPGTALRIDGRVLTDEGRAAVQGAIVFAWQTDASGRYDVPGSAPHSWRLHGWAMSDAGGRFVFDTIRPGPYPGRTDPAHVHFTVERRDGRRYIVPELLLSDDPLVTRQHHRDPGSFVGSVERTSAGERVNLILMLEETRRF